MTIKTIVFGGDSLMMGTAYYPIDYSKVGPGSFIQQDADRLANISGVGPLISSGVRPHWLGFPGVTSAPAEVVETGSWADCTSSDAFDKMPYGRGRYANGSGNTVLWTIPKALPPVVGFKFYWVDLLVGGNWSYRIDGGAWTAMGQTLANDQKMAQFYVSGTVTSTLEVRAANAAGTAVWCLPFGPEWFFRDPATTTGLIVHNLGSNGAFLRDLVASTSGDRMAFYGTGSDGAIKNGTGSPISNRANCASVGMWINDISLNDAGAGGGYDQNLTTWTTRQQTLATVILMNAWGLGDLDSAMQIAYRARLKAVAATNGVQVKDFFDDYNALGYGSTNATQSAKLLSQGLVGPTDSSHINVAGHTDIARRLYPWLRGQLFSSFATAPSSFPVSGKRAAVAYSGKSATVAYSAGQPVSVT